MSTQPARGLAKNPRSPVRGDRRDGDLALASGQRVPRRGCPPIGMVQPDALSGPDCPSLQRSRLSLAAGFLVITLAHEGGPHSVTGTTT